MSAQLLAIRDTAPPIAAPDAMPDTADAPLDAAAAYEPDVAATVTAGGAVAAGPEGSNDNGNQPMAMVEQAFGKHWLWHHQQVVVYYLGWLSDQHLLQYLWRDIGFHVQPIVTSLLHTKGWCFEVQAAKSSNTLATKDNQPEIVIGSKLE
ncbi:hypothetical protein BDN71DRAFT_1433918 [Pleurotus eryngii]|uniref:Uncharacterized protein n=1 Tax=Pleurotus eryngii TaxID=5323 RepID=A0A9P5ZPY6_PLEER|nr:hypothetical protein BDN71DRAFT_1433918 [Pleurotus eryngii]